MRRWAAISLLGITAACGPDPGPLEWIDARAAVVQCTSSGRDRMPPVLLDLPAPVPPTGLYARALDPMALNDLGYQRDTVACAMLTPAEPSTTTADAATLTNLLTVREAAGREAIRAAGPCACDVVNGAGMRGLVPQCLDRPTQPTCDPEKDRDAVLAALEPALEAVAQTRPPLMHWRLVGKTDREGWFVERQATLLARHEGGSTIYVRGQAVPLRDNGELIRALLDEEGVVAVAHQDSGRGLLVVRELGSRLVLDHFAYPVVGPRELPLLAFIDNANVERYRSLLAKPSATRKLTFDPAKGNLIEVDVGQLAEVDGVFEAAAPLASLPVAPSRELPARRVERVAVQAPFGKQGTVLEVAVALTEDGREWANLLTNSPLSPTLDELGEEEPVLPDEVRSELPYALAGTAFESSVVYGLEQVTGLMKQVEMRYPSSVQGSARAWSFAMPPSDLSGLVTEAARFEGLRKNFEAQAYGVEVSVADDSTRITATIAPK